MAWEFKREEQRFTPIPEGDYRIRVKSVEKATSSKGNDMLALQFDVSGKKQVLYHYITFMKDHPEITNRMLTQFFDSFKDISEGNFNTQTWVGKVGACHVKHEDYNGSPSAKIGYFINVNKQGNLPPWQEVSRDSDNDYSGIQTDADGFMQVPDLPDFDDI